MCSYLRELRISHKPPIGICEPHTMRPSEWVFECSFNARSDIKTESCFESCDFDCRTRSEILPFLQAVARVSSVSINEVEVTTIMKIFLRWLMLPAVLVLEAGVRGAVRASGASERFTQEVPLVTNVPFCQRLLKDERLRRFVTLAPLARAAARTRPVGSWKLPPHSPYHNVFTMFLQFCDNPPGQLC